MRLALRHVAGLLVYGLLLAVCRGLLAVCSVVLLGPGSRDGGCPGNSHACVQAMLLEGRSVRESGDFFPIQPFVSNVFLKESWDAGLALCKGENKL